MRIYMLRKIAGNVLQSWKNLAIAEDVLQESHVTGEQGKKKLGPSWSRDRRFCLECHSPGTTLADVTAFLITCAEAGYLGGRE